MTDRSTFHLGYEWVLDGNVRDAFYYISHIATWPDWWPQIVSVVTEQPHRDDVQVGDSALMVAKSMLPYRLDWHTVVRRIESPYLIEVDSRVTLGDRLALTGVVSFELQEQIGKIVAVNKQVMTAERPLPRWAHPFADWVFNFNHDYAMKRGAPGLQKLLDQQQAAKPLATLEPS